MSHSYDMVNRVRQNKALLGRKNSRKTAGRTSIPKNTKNKPSTIFQWPHPMILKG